MVRVVYHSNKNKIRTAGITEQLMNDIIATELYTEKWLIY